MSPEADIGGDIVVTAARGTDRSLATLPISVSVLDEAQIGTQLAVSVNLSRGLAASVPGFNFIGDATDSGSAIGARLRGRDTITVFNGVPINTLFFGVGVDLANFDSQAIGRVEVIRAASAAYGFGANGGIISVTTKRPTEEGISATSKAGVEVITANTDGLSYWVYQDVMGKSDRVEWRVGASFRDTGKPYAANGAALPTDGSYYSKHALNLDGYLKYNLAEGHAVEVMANYFKSTWQDQVAENGGCVPALDSPTGRIIACDTEPRDRTDVLFGDSIGAGRLDVPNQENLYTALTYTADDVMGSTVTAQLFYAKTHYTFSGYSFLDLFEDDQGQIQCGFTDADGSPIANCQVGAQLITDESRIGTRLNADTPLGDKGGRVFWGYDFLRYRNTNDISNGTIPADIDPLIYSTGPITQTSHAVFAQFDYPIGPLNLSAGVRHERISARFDSYLKDYPFRAPFEGGKISYDATVFNAGLIWEVKPGTQLFTGFSQGYDVTDLARGTFQVTRAADIDPAPATATNYELGIRHRNSWLTASGALFYSNSSNGNRLQAQTNEVTGELLNAIVVREPRRIWGVEATADVRVGDKVNLGGTFAWQDGETDVIDTDGTVQSTIELDNGTIAPLKITAYFEYKPTSFLTLRPQAIYTGSRTVAGARDSNGDLVFDRGPVRSVFLADFTAVADVGKGRIELGISNLFNKYYFTPYVQSFNFYGSLNPDVGRTVRLSYTHNW